jgi:hypothetical protein
MLQLGQNKKDRAIPASVLCSLLVNAYALSGTILTVRTEIIFVFNQAFAHDRPKNGATAIITNAIPNAICINLSPFSPRFIPSGNSNDPNSFCCCCSPESHYRLFTRIPISLLRAGDEPIQVMQRCFSHTVPPRHRNRRHRLK